MAKAVEFFFDVGSPASYLAWTQLPPLCAEHGADLVYRPMLLGGVFQATGNASPATVPAKGAYTRGDLARFARRYGVPLLHNSHFPILTLTLMRGATAVANRPDLFQTYLSAVFGAIWRDDLDMNDRAVVVRVLAAAGLDPDEILASASEPATKSALKETTDEAVRRGVFGAPTMFVGGEMFFGQDRLDFVRDALR
jgi:2-hydroxychromene-2-carboxylate isomerase